MAVCNICGKVHTSPRARTTCRRAAGQMPPASIKSRVHVKEPHIMELRQRVVQYRQISLQTKEKREKSDQIQREENYFEQIFHEMQKLENAYQNKKKELRAIPEGEIKLYAEKRAQVLAAQTRWNDALLTFQRLRQSVLQPYKYWLILDGIKKKESRTWTDLMQIVSKARLSAIKDWNTYWQDLQKWDKKRLVERPLKLSRFLASWNGIKQRISNFEINTVSDRLESDIQKWRNRQVQNTAKRLNPPQHLFSRAIDLIGADFQRNLGVRFDILAIPMFIKRLKNRYETVHRALLYYNRIEPFTAWGPYQASFLKRAYQQIDSYLWKHRPKPMPRSSEYNLPESNYFSPPQVQRQSLIIQRLGVTQEQDVLTTISFFAEMVRGHAENSSSVMKHLDELSLDEALSDLKFLVEKGIRIICYPVDYDPIFREDTYYIRYDPLMDWKAEFVRYSGYNVDHIGQPWMYGVKLMEVLPKTIQ